jgi:hypothetical protein
MVEVTRAKSIARRQKNPDFGCEATNNLDQTANSAEDLEIIELADIRKQAGTEMKNPR